MNSLLGDVQSGILWRIRNEFPVDIATGNYRYIGLNTCCYILCYNNLGNIYTLVIFLFNNKMEK